MCALSWPRANEGEKVRDQSVTDSNVRGAQDQTWGVRLTSSRLYS